MCFKDKTFFFLVIICEDHCVFFDLYNGHIFYFLSYNAQLYY